ncbi:MAG TPA: RRQRL motif-containing zinc-binding protein [Kribbella sp.]|uniref:RRQRL motif-containing zinc-binding protein n=1 Tax=Kribbella sp. TaxID=1871183 RepID=UPI002D794EAF|nr:RRQRL motif-containing zinc-binding protein [Kribbella sp.]HET6293689.1 RRQRL motif-containing zinc-binding protein [Kribbella sp.]
MTRGVEWVRLWDGRRWPGRVRDGLPEFGFGQAPSGLSTRRQLRERGMSRGGQEPFARLSWKRDQRFAWLYVDAHAKPKRTASEAQLAAVEKALAARKVCAECGPVDHFVRTTDQLCGDCHADGVTPTAGGTSTWKTLHDWQREAQDTGQQAARSDDPVGRGEASAAIDRAAEAVTRAATHHDEERAAQQVERDEQLIRWHSNDDNANDCAATEADTRTDALEWEAGAA